MIERPVTVRIVEGDVALVVEGENLGVLLTPAIARALAASLVATAEELEA